jgi:TolA-binding protein
MICNNCGSTIEDGSLFCAECGARVEPQEPAGAQPEKQPDVQPETEPAQDDAFTTAPLAEAPAPEASVESVKKKKGRLWIIGGATLAVLIAAALIVVGVIRKNNYAAASALFDAGGYTEAAEAFTALGNYKDSASRAQLSTQWADYTHACDLIETFDHDDATEAEQIFLSLGAFEDAQEKAVFCRNSLDYEAAEDLVASGDYAGAEAAFEALGTFSDAADRARFCSDTQAYQAACILMEQGDYAGAAEKFAAPAESGFEDAADQLTYCGNMVAYQNAEAALADGKNYEAYRAFIDLGVFEDAYDRAKACALEEPKSGEIYHNENYKSRQADLKVVNSYSKATYLKLYASNGDLVCTLYIQAGKNATIHVPAGTYTLNRAFGTMWFGPEDMFGDEGTYYRQKIGDSYEFTMKSNYIYTLSSGTGGTPVVDNETERGGF